jgi:hypothetical protein
MRTLTLVASICKLSAIFLSPSANAAPTCGGIVETHCNDCHTGECFACVVYLNPTKSAPTCVLGIPELP